MAKYEETITHWSCDFCGEDCNTKHEPFQFKGKYFCNVCKEELAETLKEDD